ncbi:uncharacterized protein SEPMUDRAFT_160996 [Sphaerulina musiva SO2202]|uniref:Aminoglycoside phosphotransferase domain-containing protein n=1 Tax=Sphaerulina musiva (strain SO2202) TaxID=692275 RepID=N1QN03_SPHMS|nr:uncharacterized protein SEPMUDRAFT_160996 [Sphaerulina musiva SO2202]EMF17812.1 hypothetical protein SEPMUDRAFT_160996 [Sphaerulina musiva SO2202]
MIKWNCEEPELEGLRYVAANTDILIPRLCRVHRSHHQLALEMGFFSGCGPLQVCWRNYTCNQKQAIVDEIVAFIKQLRKLEAPCPQRISRTARFGPFDDIAAFHDCVRDGIALEYVQGSFGAKVLQVHQRQILVRDAKVVALIDWECAGWYPGYWEYTRAH